MSDAEVLERIQLELEALADRLYADRDLDATVPLSRTVIAALLRDIASHTRQGAPT